MERHKLGIELTVLILPIFTCHVRSEAITYWGWGLGVGMQNLNPLILNFRIVSILKITKKSNTRSETGSIAPCSLSRTWTN